MSLVDKNFLPLAMKTMVCLCVALILCPVVIYLLGLVVFGVVIPISCPSRVTEEFDINKLLGIEVGQSPEAVLAALGGPLSMHVVEEHHEGQRYLDRFEDAWWYALPGGGCPGGLEAVVAFRGGKVAFVKLETWDLVAYATGGPLSYYPYGIVNVEHLRTLRLEGALGLGWRVVR